MWISSRDGKVSRPERASEPAITMNAADRVCEAFPEVAARAFSQAAFTPPTGDNVAVLVFDGAAWLDRAAVAEHLLDPGERQRAARFRFTHDRMAYVLAHAMWRSALGLCLGCDAAAVPMTSTPAGQPQLPGTPWATSLSHSGSWVALAVGRAAVLGVDIERSPPLRALNDLVSTICTPREATDMHDLPPVAREYAMLRLWTRKEALLKAFGTGLSGPSPATFTALPDACVAPPPGLACPPCRVHELQLPKAVVGALAVPDGAGERRLHILDAPAADEGRAGEWKP